MATNVQWRFRWSLECIKDGVSRLYETDPLIVAQGLIAYAASTGRRFSNIDRTITAGQTVDLWTWSESANLGLLIAEVTQPADVLQVEWSGDRPTSASDTTASGAAVTFNAAPFITFGAPLIATSTRILTNVTEANHVGSGTALGGTGPLAAAGEEEGRIYRFRVKNPLATDVRVVGGVLVN